ncbi:MAG TPA: hypothetical protein DCZ48_11250 [Methylococcaceae bacterium]|nr:hypothetical protein [Methylococcaceae bacterium]
MEMSTPLETLKNLLKRNESDTVDFKTCNYAFGNGTPEEKKRKRAEFVKDIISMVNTPREESAYVVLGVKCFPDGRKSLEGIDVFLDDADLQSKFIGICHPHPRFKYEPVQYQEKNFAFIEIPADTSIGPIVPVTDVGNVLRMHAVYHRRNSQNAMADISEQKRIFGWFSGSMDLRPPSDYSDPLWEQFLSAIHGGDSIRKYILITSPGIVEQGGPVENLTNVPWLFVADFDHKSQECGLLARVAIPIGDRISLHKVAIDTDTSINPLGATYWYFARGVEGRISTLSTGSWIDWQKKYARDIQKRLASVAGACNSPVTIVVLWAEPSMNRHLDSLLSAAVTFFGDSADIVIATPTDGPCEDLANQYAANNFELPFPQLFHGFGSLKGANETDRRSTVFPSSSGADIRLDESTITWLKEEMTLVGKNAGLAPETEDFSRSAFLRGREISWFELGLHLDVDRDIAGKMSKIIRSDLEKRSATRINLYHAPGAGGSTLARRLLWDFKNEFPAIVLLRCQPTETVERIQKIFSETAQSVLIEVDGSRISERQSDELYKLLAANNIPFVMLQVLRRFDMPQTSQRAFYLDRELSTVENARFVAALSREIPSKKADLDAAAKLADGRYHSLFYLGLVAFERDFSTIERYVSAHIADLNEVQKRILAFLAIAHYYGQQSVAGQSFAEVLNIPPNRNVELSEALPDAALSLLVRLEKGRWRTVHHLVAEELIQQILSAPTADKRIWRHQLADWAIKFSDFCNRRLPEPSHENLELLRRIFIYRDESEIIGSEGAGGIAYSQIITDIPVPQGQQRVLQHLTELFPYEAHFLAHFARFLANEFEDFEAAIEMADRALEIEPNDQVIHHMKGMVCRSQVYDQIRKDSPLDTILPTAKLASSAFAKARERNPDDDHGFISEAQLIIRVLDYTGKVVHRDPVSAAASHSDPWIREGFQSVEDLLMQVRQKRRDRADSQYELRCQADLNTLYGKHENALQIWDNLLTGRVSVYAPPIRRQVVWTLLARRERDWARMTPKEVGRSVELLESNIKEDPNDDRNIRLWIQAIRYHATPPTVETVVERVAYWASNTDTLEANYYLYVLHMLLAINGSTVAIDQAARAMQRCREKSRYRSDRTWSYEWLGKESGLKQLVHHNLLGEWDHTQRFWQDTSSLDRVKGVISTINGPQAGTIELATGIKAFFVPGVSGHSASRSANSPVTFFLGFSYEGLRAWSVQDA